MSIAQQHEDYYLNIRNPQLARCSEEVAELLRYYGVLDIEFDALMEMIRSSMFNYVLEEEFPDDDDDDECELD